MNALIDIVHPAHVHFFLPLIRALVSDGWGVIVAARDKDVTLDLLRHSRTPFVVPKSTKSKGTRFQKAVELFQRVVQLRRIIRTSDIGIVLTRNPAGVLAAIGTRAYSVFDTDDGRHAGIHYWLSRPFADVITCSTHDIDIRGRRVQKYVGLKPQMALHPSRFSPDWSVRRRLISDDELLFVARFSAYDAAHDFGERGLSSSARSRLVEVLTEFGTVVASFEHEGLRMFSQGRDSLSVDVHPHEFHNLLGSSDLFVGDSQSVAAEAAILGVPSIRLSTFSNRLFYLQLLEARGLVQNFTPDSQDEFFEAVGIFLQNRATARLSAAEKAHILNSESEDLVAWFVHLVCSLTGAPNSPREGN